MDDLSSGIAWLPWGRDAFARARDNQAPILLAIGASWCKWCAEMSRTTYRDRAVCQLIDRSFVPVWVDAAHRPDVNERYNLGGWPTTAFLTPAGQLLGGETYVGPARMATLLEQVANAYAAGRHEIDERAEVTPVPLVDCGAHDPADDDHDLVEWLESQVLGQFDAVHGGFGTEDKRVHAPTLQFALRRYAQGHTALGEVVVRTLDAIGWGGLYDDVDGGVFRYCAGRDWTAPRVEKLLSVNASVLQLLLDGWLVMGEVRYRDRAADLLRYVWDVLADRAAGGFFASQYADDHYYDSDVETRGALGAPLVDQSVYADGTARMAAAYLRAAEAFGDSSLLEFSVISLERVVADTYQRGAGVAHDVSGDQIIRGLLGDQVWVSDVLLDLYGATDREVYLDMAQELMRFSLRSLWDTHTGGFVDRVVAADDIGLLREPIKPFGANCAAARVLVRLSRETGHDDLREHAVETLASQASAARARGVDAAPCALAAIELAS